MTHLTDDQAAAIALDEPGGDAAWREHVARCRACEVTVADLRETLHAVRRVDVPEPSPLYWASLSTRISNAIDDPHPRRTWLGMPWLAWTGAAAAIVVAIAIFTAELPGGSPGPVQESIVGPIASHAQADPERMDALSDADPDEAWEVVRSVAAGLEYDDVREAGIAPRPGAIERAALELDDDERAELVRLLENEMKRSGV